MGTIAFVLKLKLLITWKSADDQIFRVTDILISICEICNFVFTEKFLNLSKYLRCRSHKNLKHPIHSSVYIWENKKRWLKHIWADMAIKYPRNASFWPSKENWVNQTQYFFISHQMFMFLWLAKKKNVFLMQNNTVHL